MNKIFKNRNGIDTLSLFMVAIAFLFLSNKYTTIVGVGIIVLAIMRVFSKNITKRKGELFVFNQALYKFAIWINKMFRPITQPIKSMISRHKKRKIYKYIKCKDCKKKLRVPKNKGKLKVTCPECKNHFTIVS